MSSQNQVLRERIELLERENARLRGRRTAQGDQAGQRSHHKHAPPPTIRKRSTRTVLGLPLWEIASGPDTSNGEKRGHARAIFAVGDVADGVVAVGGIARGGLCIGGVTFGLITLGGVSLSLLAAMGGVAIAPFAFGGAAVGGVAIGGAAVGYYAKGDAATGRFAMDKKEQNPEAVRFFDRWLPKASTK